MKIVKLEPEITFDQMAPSCANLAVQEYPVLIEAIARRRFALTFDEQKNGFDPDGFDWDMDDLKKELFMDLMDRREYLRDNCRHLLSKDIKKYDLRLFFSRECFEAVLRWRDR